MIDGRDQRGFVLISAVILSVLYFALITLLLMDSSRELIEAQRFRARIVALTLAENGAELAAAKMVTRAASPPVNEDTWQGVTTGRYMRGAGTAFEIRGEGQTKGVVKVRATVRIYGEVVGNDIKIAYSMHSQ